jgi:hypothetical protein
MIPVSLGSVVAGVATTHRHLLSARPDAPMVPETPRTSARPLARTRTATATVLVRAAHLISPA